MFIETIVWMGGATLSVAGLAAMLRGQVDSPEWWLILAWILAAAIGAAVRSVPFHIKATDRSRLQLGKDDVQA